MAKKLVVGGWVRPILLAAACGVSFFVLAVILVVAMAMAQRPVANVIPVVLRQFYQTAAILMFWIAPIVVASGYVTATRWARLAPIVNLLVYLVVVIAIPAKLGIIPHGSGFLTAFLALTPLAVMVGGWAGGCAFDRSTWGTNNGAPVFRGAAVELRRVASRGFVLVVFSTLGCIVAVVGWSLLVLGAGGGRYVAAIATILFALGGPSIWLIWRNARAVILALAGGLAGAVAALGFVSLDELL